MNAKLVLENGSVYEGNYFGKHQIAHGELVFNTSVVGYQEIISDPSYKGQSVVMTYPWIGNYGINDFDFESTGIHINAFIVKELNDNYSNYQATKSLEKVFLENNITGIQGIDTRKLVREIRTKGSMKSAIVPHSMDVNDDLIKRIKNWVFPNDVVSQVSTKKVIEYNKDGKYKVVAIDCGIKGNIIKELVKRDCYVIRVPYNTDAKTIKNYNPDGIFTSNGPGDPQVLTQTIETIKNLQGYKPIFGICLGNQLISLSYGANTRKMKFGHRGGNHPVMDLTTGRVAITTQNHSYEVDSNTVHAPLEITHKNLTDNTVEGVEIKKDKIFSVQYHPESCPGPEDSKYLFDKFLRLIKENKHA